ncbi:MAG: 30S ribosomal protein S20 [Acidobacteriota bacterium]
MAQRHASALKHQRQSLKNRLRNKKNLGNVKGAVRAQRELLAKGDAAAATKNVSATTSEIDRAAAKGVIHKNAAARKKSRLQKKLNELAKKKA